MPDLKPIAAKIREADAILIGASNGLSITEGLHLFADNGAFERLFGDFKRKYGLRCILQGMMAGWPSEPNATYVTINLGEVYIADNIKEKSFGLDGRLDELLPALREACGAEMETFIRDGSLAADAVCDACGHMIPASTNMGG